MIHGATAFSHYDDFLNYLRTKPIEDPLNLNLKKRWRDLLQVELGEQYEVYLPLMPNSHNAHYEEWKIWFNRYLKFLCDGAILIGHSQGGYFLAKHLSENRLPISLRAVYFIAAPIGSDDFGLVAESGGEDGGDFSFDRSNLIKMASQSQKIVVVHSKDDPVVPFSHALAYKDALPMAEILTFSDKGHFNNETFPELVEHIKLL